MSRTSSLFLFFKIVPSTLVRILRAHLLVPNIRAILTNYLLVPVIAIFCSDQVILLVFHPDLHKRSHMAFW